MRRPPPSPPDTEPLLFDLPLDRPPRDDEAEPRLDRPPARAGRAPREGREKPNARDAARPPQAARLEPAREAVERQTAVPTPTSTPTRKMAAAAAAAAEAGDQHAGAARAGIGRRLAAGAADLLVHVAVAVVALAGCRYLGVFPVPRDWPAAGVFLLSFSFLYTVVPLAFWGHTLGMTWAGLTSQSTDGEPLSFEQTARRWLGMLLTLATLGVPLLLALGGRSLADRLSGSRTLLLAAGGAAAK